MLTADEVKKALEMRPHPREGGWYVRTYEAHEMIAETAFSDARYPAVRRTGTAIYYLLERDTFSEMHLLQSDEIFHFYAGDTVEQLRLFAGGRGEVVVIGSNLTLGQRPQVVVPRGVWQGARLAQGGEHGWALLGCTVSPGFEFEDYEAGEAAELLRGWPAWAPQIRGLCRKSEA